MQNKAKCVNHVNVSHDGQMNVNVSHDGQNHVNVSHENQDVHDETPALSIMRRENVLAIIRLEQETRAKQLVQRQLLYAITQLDKKQEMVRRIKRRELKLWKEVNLTQRANDELKFQLGKRELENEELRRQLRATQQQQQMKEKLEILDKKFKKKLEVMKDRHCGELDKLKENMRKVRANLRTSTEELTNVLGAHGPLQAHGPAHPCPQRIRKTAIFRKKGDSSRQ